MIQRIVLPNGLAVDAGDQKAIIDRGVQLVLQRRQGNTARIITALHVGGLQYGSDKHFVSALSDANLVCADGAAVVALCRLAGQRTAERAPTTDVGLAILSEAVSRGRRLKFAVIGAAEGTAPRAGRELELRTGAELVYATHGYHGNWQPVLEAINASKPDVIVLGLGSPYETKWASDFKSELRGTIVTCGGWLGFLTGKESRAPLFLQNAGLEWTWRLVQDPRRLASRYMNGLLVTVALATKIVRSKQVRV